MFVLPIWPRQPSIRAKTPKHHTEFGKTPSTIKIKQIKKNSRKRVGSGRCAGRGTDHRAGARNGETYRSARCSTRALLRGPRSSRDQTPSIFDVPKRAGTASVSAVPAGPPPRPPPLSLLPHSAAAHPRAVVRPRQHRHHHVDPRRGPPPLRRRRRRRGGRDYHRRQTRAACHGRRG